MTDQHRWDALGWCTPWVQTPNLNKLASTGLVCPVTITQSPQCQPARASILTGRYPTAHKVWWNETKLPINELTIGNYFKAEGYQTGYFGKLHVDGDGDCNDVATRLGFTHCYLTEHWQQDLIHYSLDDRARLRKEFYEPMHTKSWTGEISNPAGHHDEVITDKAIEWVKQAPKPFLAIISFHGPHPPYSAPSQFSNLYKAELMSVPTANSQLDADEWRKLKVQYFGAVSWIDHNIGKIIETLSGQDTIVFTSDHGDILGDHGLFSKGMFAYDGNIRVPLIIRSASLQGRYNYLTESVDILPTLLASQNISISSAIQGKSLIKAIQKQIPIRESAISMIGHLPRLRMIRTLMAKYWICGQEETLFDLLKFDAESNNLSKSNKLLLEEMRFKLMQKLIECEDPMPYPSSSG